MKGTYYTIEIRDKEGKLLKHIKRKSRSFVQQWNELLSVQVGYKANLSMKDTGGTDRNIDYYAMNFMSIAAAANDAYGIVIGTGTTAVAIADCALATQIAEGTGAGQISHQACTVSDPSVSAPSCSFTVTRIHINNSGAAIVVKEIGLYIRAYDAATPYNFLAIRDVLASEVSVPDGGGITVVYTIKVTV